MDKNIKRQHSSEFKARVVLEVLKETKTVGQIGSEFNIHPTQVKRWRDTALMGLKDTFTDNHGKVLKEKDDLIDQLYRQVGKLQTELDWLKKKMGYSS